VRVSHRPLVLVSGLTFGDFLLWHWSLNAKHDVLALVSGLSLPILGVACVWLLIVTVMRLLVRHSRPVQPVDVAGKRRPAPARGDADAPVVATGARAGVPDGTRQAGSDREPQPAVGPASGSRRSARKIAA
jgi:hypothetical protein